MSKQREVVQAVIDDLRAVLREAERPARSGGARVPFRGPFAAVLHYPSVVADIREIVRTLEQSL